MEGEREEVVVVVLDQTQVQRRKVIFYVMYSWVPYRASACTDTRAMQNVGKQTEIVVFVSAETFRNNIWF